jgi:hypothetical protein
MVRFDGAPKVFVSNNARKIYEFFCSTEKIFPQLVDLFQVSAAIGIHQKKRKKLEDRDELVNTYSIDQDEVFESLIKELHPEADGKERLNILQEYAEAGIFYLKDYYDKHGVLRFSELFAELRIPLKSRELT